MMFICLLNGGLASWFLLAVTFCCTVSVNRRFCSLSFRSTVLKKKPPKQYRSTTIAKKKNDRPPPDLN